MTKNITNKFSDNSVWDMDIKNIILDIAKANPNMFVYGFGHADWEGSLTYSSCSKKEKNINKLIQYIFSNIEEDRDDDDEYNFYSSYQVVGFENGKLTIYYEDPPSDDRYGSIHFEVHNIDNKSREEIINAIKNRTCKSSNLSNRQIRKILNPLRNGYIDGQCHLKTHNIDDSNHLNIIKALEDESLDCSCIYGYISTRDRKKIIKALSSCNFKKCYNYSEFVSANMGEKFHCADCRYDKYEKIFKNLLFGEHFRYIKAFRNFKFDKKMKVLKNLKLNNNHNYSQSFMKCLESWDNSDSSDKSDSKSCDKVESDSDSSDKSDSN
jgi:hypothetical protein